MKTIRRLMLTTVLALAALTTAQAQDQSPPVGDRFSFGMVGIVPGQTLRLHVANIGDIVCPCSRVVLTFLDTNGQRLRAGDGSILQRAVELRPGRAAFLDLNADDPQWPPGPSRLQVRAVVSVYPPGPSDIAFPPSNIVPSVEILSNRNGRTVVFISSPGVIRGFNPQPDPPLGQ